MDSSSKQCALFKYVLAVRCTVQRFIAKSAKSERHVLNAIPLVLKITGDTKILKTAGEH
jgi:hypothetical protein